jgi:hypothetical protein
MVKFLKKFVYEEKASTLERQVYHNGLCSGGEVVSLLEYNVINHFL